MQTNHLANKAKLALGTVQFGMPYGIMNGATEAVPEAEVAAILALAWRRGVDMLDTAVGYGRADEIVAAVCPADISFACVTKMPPLGDEDAEVRAAEIVKAQAKLRVSAFYAVLLHRADDLLGPKGGAVARALEELRRCGVCERTGVSVYDPATLNAVLDLASDRKSVV